jgi:hypothetical protein
MGPQEAITLQPSFLRTIDHASASYLSAMGLVKVAWQRTAEKDSVDITIPAGAQAHLNLPPLGNWEEKDTPVAQAAGVLSSKPSAAGIDMLLGSGSYHFSTLPISTAVQGDRPLE